MPNSTLNTQWYTTRVGGFKYLLKVSAPGCHKTFNPACWNSPHIHPLLGKVFGQRASFSITKSNCKQNWNCTRRYAPHHLLFHWVGLHRHGYRPQQKEAASEHHCSLAKNYSMSVYILKLKFSTCEAESNNGAGKGIAGKGDPRGSCIVGKCQPGPVRTWQ